MGDSNRKARDCMYLATRIRRVCRLGPRLYKRNEAWVRQTNGFRVIEGTDPSSDDPC